MSSLLSSRSTTRKLCYEWRDEKMRTAHMARFVGLLLGALVCALLPVSACCAAETIRVAAQKTGTLAWELAVIRAHGLDKQQDIEIQTAELASPEAGKIALRAGSADLVVSDCCGC